MQMSGIFYWRKRVKTKLLYFVFPSLLMLLSSCAAPETPHHRRPAAACSDACPSNPDHHIGSHRDGDRRTTNFYSNSNVFSSFPGRFLTTSYA